MKIDFDFDKARTAEFGVGRDTNGDSSFVLIPVDGDVQGALREMAVATKDAMYGLADKPTLYSPSEKHSSLEYLVLPRTDDMAQRVRELYDAANMPIDSRALTDPKEVFCYFAKMTDARGRRLTALRRATQFKGVLKKRLIRLVDDALKVVDDKVFKLDTDFDLLMDAHNVHILRPAAFEFVGELQDAVLAAAPDNVRLIQHDLGFVDFGGVEEYATKHPRAARYLASIRAQGEARNIDKKELKRICGATGIEFSETRGKMVISDEHVMDFLEVLDRRRFESGLVPGSPEWYRASSRQKLGPDT